MFNLLRRSRRGKTHKIVDEDEDGDTPVRYSKIGDISLSREERPERARRAVIEELEDFASDFDDDATRKNSDDGDEERLKLAKTAANGRSDNLYINKMGGDARTWSFSSGGDRNAAPSSQNEAASAIASKSYSGQLIGTIESEILAFRLGLFKCLHSCRIPQFGALAFNNVHSTISKLLLLIG